MFALCLVHAVCSPNLCAHRVSVDPGRKGRKGSVSAWFQWWDVVWVPGSSWGWLGPELTETSVWQTRQCRVCCKGGPHCNKLIIIIMLCPQHGVKLLGTLLECTDGSSRELFPGPAWVVRLHRWCVLRSTGLSLCESGGQAKPRVACPGSCSS